MKKYYHRNKCWIKGDTGFIELCNNKGEVVGIAMVDREDLLRCMKVKWYLNHCTKNTTIKSNKIQTTLSRYVLRLEKDISGATPLYDRRIAYRSSYSNRKVKPMMYHAPSGKLFVYHRDEDIMNCRKSNLIITLGEHP